MSNDVLVDDYGLVPAGEWDALVKRYQSPCHRGDRETPEQAARGWLLTCKARRADRERRVAEFVEPTSAEIDAAATELALENLTYEALTEPGGCRYRVSEVIMRSRGGHRMSEGMAADLDAAKAVARRSLRERGLTEADRDAAYKELCADRDHCLRMLGHEAPPRKS